MLAVGVAGAIEHVLPLPDLAHDFEDPFPDINTIFVHCPKLIGRPDSHQGAQHPVRVVENIVWPVSPATNSFPGLGAVSIPLHGAVNGSITITVNFGDVCTELHQTTEHIARTRVASGKKGNRRLRNVGEKGVQVNFVTFDE